MSATNRGSRPSVVFSVFIIFSQGGCAAAVRVKPKNDAETPPLESYFKFLRTWRIGGTVNHSPVSGDDHWIPSRLDDFPMTRVHQPNPNKRMEPTRPPVSCFPKSVHRVAHAGRSPAARCTRLAGARLQVSRSCKMVPSLNAIPSGIHNPRTCPRANGGVQQRATLGVRRANKLSQTNHHHIRYRRNTESSCTRGKVVDHILLVFWSLYRSFFGW